MTQSRMYIHSQPNPPLANPGNGIVTGAERVAITHSNRAVLDAITASFTTTDETKLDQLYYPVTPDSNWLTGEQAVSNVAYSNVLTLSISDTRTRQSLITGHVTFRNTSGAGAIGYFRIRKVSGGTIYASGQADVPNNNRVTIGFSALAGSLVSGDQIVLDVRTDAASGFVATHQNGMGDGFATVLNVVATGA